MFKIYNMGLIPILLLISLVFVGCNDSDDNHAQRIPKVKLDGKVLLKSKCSKCHNIDFPPLNFDHEIAPAMMTISFHFNDWFKGASSSEKLEKQLVFISDYIINPTVEKSYCDKTMLKKYGLMPSQKDNVTVDEIRAIGKYVFATYLPAKLAKKQEALDKLNALPKGEQLIIKYHCNSCHRVDQKIVGPSFKTISKKYQNTPENIIHSIQNGSQGRWNSATMPPFKNISNNDLLIIQKWIIDLH